MPKFKYLTTHTPKLKYLLSIVFFIIIITSNAQAANHALLIGIGVYPELLKSNQLEGPPHDVAALSQVLQTHHGFESADIRTLINAQAGRSAILDALNALKLTTRPGDFIFIFFSGHGTSSYDPSKKKWGIDPNTGALIPADFKFSLSIREMMARLIIGKRDLRPILQELEKERLLFVAADACYSGNAVRSMEKRRHKYVPLPQDDLFADETPAPYSSAAIPEPPYPYKNVVYLSASSRREKAEDIPQDAIWYGGKETVDGKPHGAMTKELAGFSYAQQRFNVSVDLIGNKGVLTENEEIGFTVRSEADAYILLLNIDTAGNINVIYPYYPRELAPIKAGVVKKWEQFGKIAPPWFGTEYLKVFAFEKQPAELKVLKGAQFAPDDPRLGVLMRMLKKAEGQAAQMTLMVKTCRDEDIKKDRPVQLK